MAGGSRASRDRLKPYQAKRDFARSEEPRGGAPAADDGTRFVIQEHHARRLHWDLRLERDGVLISWAIPKGLPESPRENRFAALTEEHPLEYLEFVGEIPKGHYGAGTMSIWDRGVYECLKWEPRKVEVALHGERLDARYALFAIGEGEQPKEWMIHRMDPPADPSSEPMPQHLQPMLARAGELPREDGGWAYEIKWDGVRAIAYSQPGELRLQSRNLKDITAQYPELARLSRALGSRRAVLDGEIVALDEQGRPSFESLQRRMHVSSPSQVKRLVKSTPVTYMLFDLLWLGGHSLMGLPYRERRERLAELRLSGEHFSTPDYFSGNGAQLFEASAEQGLEGIVAKRLEGSYVPGRRATGWLKIKNVGRQEFVIGGWLPGEGRRTRRIGALLVGVHDRSGALRYAGRVGTGLTERELDRLAAKLRPLERPSSPFTAGGPPPRGAIFCEPRLVAEIEFREWTRGGSLRAPSYKGLREDKPAAAVVREDRASAAAEGEGPGTTLLDEQPAERATIAVEGRELRLSNLRKVLYPQAGFSKRDVINYYAAIADVVIAHLEGRPLTVKRWPDGVQGKSFFQKQAPAHRPEWVRTARVPAERKQIGRAHV